MVLIFFKYYQPVCSEIESVDSVFFNTMPGTSINFYMPTVNFAFERKAYFVIEKFLLPGIVLKKTESTLSISLQTGW